MNPSSPSTVELFEEVARLRRKVAELEARVFAESAEGGEGSSQTAPLETGLPWISSDALVRFAFDDAPLGICIANREFRFVKVNKAYCRLLGYTPQELSNMTFLDVTHPDDVAIDAYLAEQVFRGDLPRYKIEKRYLTKSGDVVWVELTASLFLRDVSGRPQFGVGIVEDITERKRVAAALETSEERFRLATLATHDAIYDHDLASGYVWRNEAYQELIGPGETVGADSDWWQERIHPDDRARVLESCRQAWASRQPMWSGEYRFRRSNGEYAHLLARGLIVRDQEGRALRMIGAATDVTAARRQSQALERQSILLLSILGSLSDGVVVANPQGKFLMFNDAAIRMLGMGSTDVPTEEWSKVYGLYLPDGVTLFPPAELPLSRAMRGEEVDDARIVVHHERLSEPVWLSVNARPLLGADGSIQGGVAAFRNVTESVKSQEAHDTAQAFSEQMLVAYDRERQLLAYEIHDGLVQEVTAALLHLEALAPRVVAAEELVQAAGEDLPRVLKLLRSALAEGRRLMCGLRPPMIDELGLAAAIEHLVEEENERGGIEVRFERPEGFPRLDPFIEASLYRIVQEALANVRRHSQSDKATVKLSREDVLIQLEVRDWGQGFRLSKVPKRRFGLQGMRERARLLGGRASIHTAPGAGTRISVELPIHPPVTPNPVTPS